MDFTGDLSSQGKKNMITLRKSQNFELKMPTYFYLEGFKFQFFPVCLLIYALARRKYLETYFSKVHFGYSDSQKVRFQKRVNQGRYSDLNSSYSPHYKA